MQLHVTFISLFWQVFSQNSQARDRYHRCKTFYEDFSRATKLSFSALRDRHSRRLRYCKAMCAAYLRQHDSTCVFPITGLPFDLVVQICAHLDPVSQVCLAKASKHLACNTKVSTNLSQHEILLIRFLLRVDAFQTRYKRSTSCVARLRNRSRKFEAWMRELDDNHRSRSLFEFGGLRDANLAMKFHCHSYQDLALEVLADLTTALEDRYDLIEIDTRLQAEAEVFRGPHWQSSPFRRVLDDVGQRKRTVDERWMDGDDEVADSIFTIYWDESILSFVAYTLGLFLGCCYPQTTQLIRLSPGYLLLCSFITPLRQFRPILVSRVHNFITCLRAGFHPADNDSNSSTLAQVLKLLLFARFVYAPLAHTLAPFLRQDRFLGYRRALVFVAFWSWAVVMMARCLALEQKIKEWPPCPPCPAAGLGVWGRIFGSG